MDTTNIRQRMPFKSSDDEPGGGRILDDQEQEEVIHNLRVQNAASSRQQLLVLGATLALSCLLQLTYIFSPSKTSPLLVIIPSNDTMADAPIPLADLFACLSLAIHLNLALLLFPGNFQPWLQSVNLRSLSYRVSYALSAVAPTICIVLGRSWQTVAWWSFTGAVVFVVQTVQQSMVQGSQSILEMEKLKYLAPGA